MTESQDSSNSWLLWLSAAVVAILIVVALLMAFLFTGGTEDPEVAVDLTPISGGVVVPETLAGSAALNADGSSGVVEPESEPLSIGAKVTSISSDGIGTRVYSDANANSLLMEIYKDGTAFLIVEPSDDYEGYPVESGDTSWYRIRTSDGLVGWAMAEQLVPIE